MWYWPQLTLFQTKTDGRLGQRWPIYYMLMCSSHHKGIKKVHELKE